MIIRPLSSIDDCRQVASLERIIWGYADAEDVTPPAMLIVSARRGGILLGAFDDGGALAGFVYSTPALKDGRVSQWSHTLGVVPGARSRGLGRRLKLAQRQAALDMGLDLIEWTFDPLQAENAYFNFARLGVVVEAYEVDLYGPSTSPLHAGTPTDRFVAEWRLREPHVERRVASSGIVMRDGALGRVPIVNPSGGDPASSGLHPGPADLSLDERRVLVEIPGGFVDIMERAPALALEWRLATREIFQHYLARGYRVVDFFLSRDAGRGQYLLARPAA